MTSSPSPAAVPASSALDPLLERLNTLAKWLEASTLAEVEIEHEGLRLHLKKPQANVALMAGPTVAAGSAPAPAAAAGPDPAKVFKAPLVGTFYAAANPDSPALVKIGDKVTEGQVLGIIEAMKTMNQLLADRSGTVEQILVKNASPVEFDQPLFVIG
jgi:acetyl-CoA carboxylase biotin carboxyl carrier protein